MDAEALLRTPTSAVEDFLDPLPAADARDSRNLGLASVDLQNVKRALSRRVRGSWK